MNAPRDPWSSGLGDLDGGAEARWPPAPPPGAPLPPFRPSLLLRRTRFAIDLPEASTATVDVDHSAGLASLYRDDRHVQTAEMPVEFQLERGRIDVAASRFGMERISLVAADGSQRQLVPAPGTPEHWRAQLSRRRPGMGRALAAAAVLVLVVNLMVLAPQLLDLLTHQSIWTGRFPSFDSPLALPAWANTALAVLGALAGVERALSLRNHWLLDVETAGMDG
ncbi:hypothetical protein [Streptomyces sedi]|uniref:Uncharacterized protein n=1 Tax=Streptomyces sedi TaxID=555059 RepID=A0A5C4VC55_9ACTN|nr:hypothetical protein [Streptomyces sedi]TNM33468.1 hypothetical protein FH715_03670 [Streptomyces sedi]